MYGNVNGYYILKQKWRNVFHYGNANGFVLQQCGYGLIIEIMKKMLDLGNITFG